MIQTYPWLTIWIKPRKTMQYLLSLGYKRQMFFSLIFFPILVELLCDLLLNVNYILRWISFIDCILLLPISAIIASLALWLGLSIDAELLEITGKWLKGRNNKAEIKMALAWSVIPVAELSVIGTGLSVIKNLKLIPAWPPILWGLGIITSLWEFVIYLNCIGEAQKFSVWKAFLNSILVVLVVVVPIGILIGAAFLGYHHGLGK